MAVRTELWRLPADTRGRLLTTLGRALTRRCPYCGSPGIFNGYFELQESCPTCGVRFEREEGYFLGGYALNLIVAEILALGIAVFVIFGTDFRHAGLLWQEALAIGLALLFPILFFPYSRGVWMALDLTFHPPTTDEQTLRGNLDRRGGSNLPY
jgi:uncharacterized protein (DUF983 family)